MPVFDEGGQQVINTEVIEEDVQIRASRITFLNSGSGRILGTFIFETGGSTLYNELGGYIGPQGQTRPSTLVAIQGSDGRDAVVNYGEINGHVELGAGDDVLVDFGTISGRVRLGAGNDAFQLHAGSLSNSAITSISGGTGSEDILLYFTDEDLVVDSLAHVTGFERLGMGPQALEGNGTFILSDVAGFEFIVASALVSSRGWIQSLDVTFERGSSGDMSDTILAGAQGGSYTLTDGLTVEGYVFYIPWDPRPERDVRDPLLGTTIVNQGTILGEVDFGNGDDVYDGRTGIVGGPVLGGAGNDTLLGGAGAESFFGGLDADILNGGLGDDDLDGGYNIDTAIVSGHSSRYIVTQTSIGVFEVSGPDGTDTLTNVEYLQFGNTTMRLLPGTGVSVNFETADPSVYQAAMENIRDFDGNALGGDGSWLRIGSADVDGDGDVDQILVNDAIGRFATVGGSRDGLAYFDDYSWAGETRVVGIYIDPLVESGDVVAGSANDSQRRFQNDLEIENINRVLGADDYDGDGLQEVYFALTDGTAYLHAYMHADGNIRYANYQSQQEVIDFLTANGYDSSTWADWFPTTQEEPGADKAGEPAALLPPGAGAAAAFDPMQATPFLAEYFEINPVQPVESFA